MPASSPGVVANLPLFLAFTCAMGLSIFLSLPLVYSRRAQGRWAVGLNAAAIGILLFLLADIFSDAALILYPNGYVANGEYATAFAIGCVVAFLGLYAVDNLRRAGAANRPASPRRLAAIIALAIGLQNLTEGLVFGNTWTAGVIGLLAVVFVGFFLQNVTEGFPITSPFLGTDAPRPKGTIIGLFLLGGVPTIAGGLIGYVWSSPLFVVTFDALAIGAIAYVILPMLRVALRPLETRELSASRDRLVYLGVLVGFILGFAVNAL